MVLKCVGLWVFGAKKYDLLIAEYGIDAVGDMKNMLDVWKPNMWILTWIDLVHAQWLGSPDITIIEKTQLINESHEIVFVHQWTSPAVENDITTEVDQLTFALHPREAQEADIWFHHFMQYKQEDGTLQASFDVDQENDTITKVTTNLLSYADAWYISLSVQIALVLERRLAIPIQLQEHTDISIDLQPWRFSILPWQYWSILIDSSYNAAPKSMKKVIDDTIKLRSQFYPDMDLIYVLWDMRELANFSEKEHRILMAHVAQSADEVFLVWPEMERFATDELIKLWYNSNHVHSSLSSREIGKQVLENLKSREKRAVVLFKWSQSTIYIEEAIKPLLKNNQKPEKLLARQDKRRTSIKDDFYKSL